MGFFKMFLNFFGVNTIQRKLNWSEEILKAVSQPPYWIEREGIIYFTLNSNSKDGPGWITFFNSHNIEVLEWAKDLLDDCSFGQANITYYVAVIKTDNLPKEERSFFKIRLKAHGLGMHDPVPNLACLILAKFSNKIIGEMGLSWIVSLHRPMKHESGIMLLLGAHQTENGAQLGACDANDRDVPDRFGCAFIMK